MILLGLKMLLNDRAKYWGLIIGITFATLLIGQQCSIFVGALSQTVSTVRDVGRGDVWVSRRGVETIDFNDPLKETDLLKVRGIKGVKSAVPLYVGVVLARTKTGSMRQVTVMGLDDATLTGAPGRMIFGDVELLKRQDAVIVDTVSKKELFGDEVHLGSTLELNRYRVEVVGLCKSLPQFSGMSKMFARRSLAAKIANEPRYAMSWFLIDLEPGYSAEDVSAEINRWLPNMHARPRHALERDVIEWFRENSGITEVLGLAIVLGLVVGTVIVGQTFYMFAVENLKHFAALKALGLGNARLMLMLLCQALMVATIGVGCGLGLTAGFFVVFANEASPLRGMGIPREVAILTSAVVISMTMASALVSSIKVLRAEPALVFKA
jgi:putative ABC transport system permease protein